MAGLVGELLEVRRSDLPQLHRVDRREAEVEDARAEAASAHKTSRRLKEVWAAKSGEFKEAIFSTLGWTVTFIPNGKMRVESVYHPSESDEHENSIVFDGERGTMKVGGGPRSAFAQRIDDQIRFWVREKGCIPGFLAALTLEFYEEQHARAVGPG
jgi:mitotic spindle assembly checkpoint protein MAD1